MRYSKMWMNELTNQLSNSSHTRPNPHLRGTGMVIYMQNFHLREFCMRTVWDFHSLQLQKWCSSVLKALTKNPIQICYICRENSHFKYILTNSFPSNTSLHRPVSKCLDPAHWELWLGSLQHNDGFGPSKARPQQWPSTRVCFVSILLIYRV